LHDSVKSKHLINQSTSKPINSYFSGRWGNASPGEKAAEGKEHRGERTKISG